MFGSTGKVKHITSMKTVPPVPSVEGQNCFDREKCMPQTMFLGKHDHDLLVNDTWGYCGIVYIYIS